MVLYPRSLWMWEWLSPVESMCQPWGRPGKRTLEHRLCSRYWLKGHPTFNSSDVRTCEGRCRRLMGWNSD